MWTWNVKSERSNINMKNRKGIWIKNILFVLGSGLLGFLLAFLMPNYSFLTEPKHSYDVILNILLLIVFVFVSVYLAIIFHEGGHYLFGKLAGFKFVSFRIGSFVLTKENGKYVIKSFSIPGTSGQCLMAPPAWPWSDKAVLIYNLGGGFLNIMSGLIALGLSFLFKKQEYFSFFLTVFALISLASAFINMIPMTNSMEMGNDGWNAVHLTKDEETSKIFWSQLEMNALSNQGVSMDQMPEDWFKDVEDEKLEDPIIASQQVMASSYYLSKKEYGKAAGLMRRILKKSKRLNDFYKQQIVIDLACCDLLEDKLNSAKEKWNRPETVKMRKMLKNYPGIVRAEALFARYADKNETSCQNYLNKLYNLKNTYPNPAEVNSEIEVFQDMDGYIIRNRERN